MITSQETGGVPLPAFSEISPKTQRRVMDLVEEAGVDVSDWKNYKGGEARAASNPRYCYKWSFVEPNKVVVLNLWHESMEQCDGVLVRNLNQRHLAHKFQQLTPRRTVWESRALEMDGAIQTAVKHNLPVRVIVCAGERRDIESGGKASQVNRRLLDPVPWAVTAYDQASGQCTLTRGAVPCGYVDQFVVVPDADQKPVKHEVSGLAYDRSPEVRRLVLLRAKGFCEFCAETGFKTTDGRVYLETHHVISLSEGGPDNIGNVVALCPNHHKEAHYGASGAEIRKALLKHLSECVALDGVYTHDTQMPGGAL